MNKPSAKTIFFAASMYYSERLVQELKERLSKNLMKYSVNNWFAVVDDDNFVPQLGFPKDFCSISFSLIENALCSGYLLHKNLRELRAMAFCDDILWKLLSDLLAPVLFPLANERFSVSANFFRYKIDSFSLAYEEYLDCMIASFPFHHEW